MRARAVGGRLGAAAMFAAALAACGGGGTGPGRTTPFALDTIDVVSVVRAAVSQMPGSGSNGYLPPSSGALADVRDAVEEIMQGDGEAAEALLGAYGYDVTLVIDDEHGDTLTLVRERTPVQRGWGTYVYRHGDDAVPADIHVNHPVSDFDTERIGAALYGECRCRWLLVAGTHRYANDAGDSDMARETASMFQAVHETAAPSGAQAISVHGFARSGHEGTPIATADLVLSNGSTTEGETAATASAHDLQDRLAAAGFAVGLFPADEGYAGLGATQNPQGRWSNDQFGHGRWIHVESAREVRDDADAWGSLVAELTDWLGALAPAAAP